VAISGGNIRMGNMKRTIRVVGSFIKIKEIGDIVIRNSSGAPVYLKEIAEVKDAYKEKESYARLDKKNVITLNIIKRSGENLIEASDKVNEVLKKLEKEKFELLIYCFFTLYVVLYYS
jgi:multidrug efflux pump subunit AcrB